MVTSDVLLGELETTDADEVLVVYIVDVVVFKAALAVTFCVEL